MSVEGPLDNFDGIITAITNIITTASGLGTASFTLNPSGYESNFGGIVAALTDLNATLSGIEGGSSNVVAGSGIYITSSGAFSVINSTIASTSGVVYTAGSGLYLRGGVEFNIDFNQTFQNSVSGHVLGAGSNTIIPSGNYILVSGVDVSSVTSYTAGETIEVGDFVCFDAGSLVKASASGGVAVARHSPIGAASSSGTAGQTVRINSDNIVVLSDANIYGETQLTPGEDYYLAADYGQITRYSSTPAGITASGGYGALVYVGRALSTTQLEVEIQPKVILTE